jgi:hypothetical protein
VGFRGVGLVSSLAILVLLSLACGSIDPDSIDVEPGRGGSSTGPGFDGSYPDVGGRARDGGTSAHDASLSHGDGSSKGDSKDGSREASGGEKDASTLLDAAAAGVFGATTYTAMPVATSATTLHAMKGGPKTVTGTSCLESGCHDGTKATTVEFLFGGTIYDAVDGGTGAEDIEVRVVNDKKTGVSAYSDTNGNFWSEATAALVTPGLAGVRNAVSLQIMPQSLSSGDCNSCHNGKTQAQMHVP